VTPDNAESVALWRFALIAEAIGPHLSPAERGLLVRQVAARAHTRADGGPCTVSRNTLDRWLRAYREHGLDGLRPGTRADTGVVRRHPELFREAAALRLERPARSAAQIADILAARHGVRISERTLRERLQRQGLQRAALTAETRVFGRYEASRPNERWITDVLVGPFVPTPRSAAAAGPGSSSSSTTTAGC
jgi:putative transposase